MLAIDAGIVLAFDTSSAQMALAAAKNPGGKSPLERLATADRLAPRKANERLVPQAADMMEELGLSPADISCVVCGRGPGSFTGVRIGVATAKGIATALGVPLHGVSTIDAVAWGLWRAGLRGHAAVAADAMRGEVYPVRFELEAAGPVRLDPDCVSKPDVVARAWAGAASESEEPLLVAGDGLKKHRDVFERAFADAKVPQLLSVSDEGLWFATGCGLLDAFESDAAAGRLDSGRPGDLLPVYTRLSDAEENERRRLGMPKDQTTPSGVADAAAVGGLVLVPMSASDVGTVVALDERLVRPQLGDSSDGQEADSVEPGSALLPAALADSLARPDETWWVAREKGRLVGYAGVRVTRGVAVLLRVAVTEEARRSGVATRLVRRAAHDAVDLGATSLVAQVPAPSCDTAAGMLLRSLGLRREVRDGGHDDSDCATWLADLPLVPQARLGEHSPSGDAGEGPEVAGMDLADSVREDPAAADASRPVHPLVLAIESSCDETAAAVIDGDEQLHADVVASQIDFHARFGGVVPEIASRKHTEAICGVVDEALVRAGQGLGLAGPLPFADLDAIAVTVGPGLVGGLVVGVAFAKGAAWAAGKPLIAVNHLEGHLYANRLIDPDVTPPLVALLVSGGNTMLVHARAWGDYEVMGSTLDDAVGEAFDKVAKALGLGYPGGPVISRLAKQGNPKAIDFPRAMLHSHDFRFSLSGLKTAVITYIHRAQDDGRAICMPDLAASFQAAVVDVLVAKARDAVRKTGVSEFCVGGGVAANPELRHDLARAMRRVGVHVTMPSFSSCTDNAGMIAAVALSRYRQGRFAGLDVDAQPGMDIEEEY